MAEEEKQLVQGFPGSCNSDHRRASHEAQGMCLCLLVCVGLSEEVSECRNPSSNPLQ